MPCLVWCQGVSPFSPRTCRSLLWFPRRSEFTDTILSVHPSDVLDMPVDPNEPTYCLCHQVSYGEMIGCDNPDVSVGATHGPRAGPCRGGRGTPSPDCASSRCLAVSYRVVSLRLRGSDHEAQRKMVSMGAARPLPARGVLWVLPPPGPGRGRGCAGPGSRVLGLSR